MKFVDLSQDPPREVEVYTIMDVARKISGSSYGSYSLRSILENWQAEPEIQTPKPAFILSETEYWKPEQIVDWQQLYDAEVQREEERKAKKLLTVKHSLSELIDKLIDRATEVERRNRNCYSHNRGNSMQDGRRRVLAFEGERDFVFSLLGDLPVPKDKRQKLSELVSQAKAHVKMQ